MFVTLLLALIIYGLVSLSVKDAGTKISYRHMDGTSLPRGATTDLVCVFSYLEDDTQINICVNKSLVYLHFI